MKKWAVLACLLLAGCESMADSTETIYMERGAESVACGPYRGLGATAMAAAAASLRDCVSDFQRQGFQRVPGPPAQ